MPCAPFEGFFPCLGDFQEVPEENKWGWEGSRGCKTKINHSSARSMGRGNAPRVRDEGEWVTLQSPKQAAGARRNESAPKKTRNWEKTGMLSPKPLPALCRMGKERHRGQEPLAAALGFAEHCSRPRDKTPWG